MDDLEAEREIIAALERSWRQSKEQKAVRVTAGLSEGVFETSAIPAEAADSVASKQMNHMTAVVQMARVFREVCLSRDTSVSIPARERVILEARKALFKALWEMENEK